MGAAIRAGSEAFAWVFAAGFVLGTVRTLVLAPRMGEVPAVLLEMPFILAICWLVWLRVLRRRALSRSVAVRGTAGATALALLLIAELLLGTAFDGSPAAALRAWTTTAGLLGLAGQVLFGMMPLAVR